MLDTGSLGNLFAFLFKFYFSIQSVTTWCSWAPPAWKFCSGWRKLLPLRNVPQSLQSINQYDSFDLFLTQSCFACQGHVHKTAGSYQQIEMISWALCAVDLISGPCYIAGTETDTVFVSLCYAAYQAKVLQDWILDLCLTLSPIVPIWFRASVSCDIFPPDYPRGLGGQRVAAWVYEPDMTTFSSQYFLKLFKWGGWIYSRSAFEVLWQ